MAICVKKHILYQRAFFDINYIKTSRGGSALRCVSRHRGRAIGCFMLAFGGGVFIATLLPLWIVVIMEAAIIITAGVLLSN